MNSSDLDDDVLYNMADMVQSLESGDIEVPNGLSKSERRAFVSKVLSYQDVILAAEGGNKEFLGFVNKIV